MALRYPEAACERYADGSPVLNYYGSPVVSPDQFMEPHAATVPAAAGEPPVCSCGWTRHQFADGTWAEMPGHLTDMEA
jgi:hypothetical protein